MIKLLCKGEYHNEPAGLHFNAPGVIEVDEASAELLMRDAPQNFEVYVAPAAPVETASGDADTNDFAGKGFDAPTKDKQVKAAPKKK